MSTITIHTDGSVSFLGECPVDLPLANPIRRRVSTIQPAHNVWKRTAFLLVRRCFGEQGRGAAWTRTWSGPWIATILATGETKVTKTRAEAIAWEIETLNQ